MEKKTMTVAAAMKYLRMLDQRKETTLRKEQENCVYLEINGEAQEGEAYSLTEAIMEVSILDSSIRNIRHAINVSNTTTEVGDTGMTVDEVLVYIAQLSNNVRRLEMLASIPARSKPRPFSPGSVDKAVTCAQFDPASAKESAQQQQSKLSELQMALDLHNLSTEVTFKSV